MLSELNLLNLKSFLKKISKEEMIWLYGYLSGIFHKKKNLSNIKITIIYSSVTGNAKNLAFNFYKRIKEKNINVRLFDLSNYCLFELKNEKYLLIIMSTHGNGEPPSSGKNFFDFIHNKNINLKNLEYSVLALGDKSYENFCKAGEDIDNQLKKLGSNRILKLYKCDVDYEKKSENWITNILNFFQENKNKSYGEKNLNKLEGIVKNNILLNKNINRKIHHIEISNFIEKIKYSPGDSIGIYPENFSDDIYKLIKIFGLENSDKKNSIFFSLKRKNIFYLSDKFLIKYSKLFNIDLKKKDFKTKKKWNLFDLIQEYPPENKDFFSIKNIIKIMDTIKPRLYSISSSSKKHINEIHITVLLKKYQLDGQIEYGYCSNFLSKIKKGDKINFFIYQNKLFQLPSPDKDIILIGPGTGIAPFRSFLYEREAINASGKNWLFFGDQYYQSDFLYKSDIQKWKENGHIHYLSLAFSRDQDKKLYVQDKIWEQRYEFYQWIKKGAYIYLCGKKYPMSLDVENMIIRVIKEFKKNDPISFIEIMKKNKRYIKDVY